MSEYEIAVLYHPDLELDLEKATKKVEKLFADNGGKVLKTDNWGKKKLAYSIAKQDHAIYVFYNVELPSEAVAKLEKTLNITDEVIRYLVTKVDHKAIAKAEEIKAEKAAKAASRTETADEENEEE